MTEGATGAPTTPPGDDEGRRELRIAPVMTGGTSLAVWIGGVTAELYRIINPRPGVPADATYRDLLALTRTRAVIDIITGTSAGGLNGVLIAAAWSLGVPTEHVIGLRDTWQALGSIDALLRKPSEQDPPSLLRGDDYFWPQLTDVLESFEKVATIAPDQRPGGRLVDLVVTVTTLAGEPTYRLDDLGQHLNETRQAHQLRFRSSKGDFARAEWTSRLALAARTSASIPGVFEASFLPIDAPVGRRPSFKGNATFDFDRWAVDGGVLVNLPLGEAIERIFDREADTEVRRVALYVDPTPSDLAPKEDDDVKAIPTVAKVALSAVTAPRNEGIAGDVDRLRENNERATRSGDIRLGIAELLRHGVATIDGLAEPLFDRYRNERTRSSVHSMLDRTRNLKEIDEQHVRRILEQYLVQAARDVWFPTELQRDDRAAWQFGLAPLQYAGALLFDLINRAYALPPALFPATDAGPSMRGRLGRLRADIHLALEELDALRVVDDTFWEEALKLVPSEPATADALRQWAEGCYPAWPDARKLAPPEPTRPAPTIPDAVATMVAAGRKLADAACTLFRWIEEERTFVGAICAAVVASTPQVALPPNEAWSALETLEWLLGTPGEAPLATEPMLDRLLAIHTVVLALGDVERKPQIVELIEVSWNAKNALDGRKPDDKVAGTEFSRLGAFVNRSWRANDWMWGRLDGAYQLVLLLLDPARLRQLELTRGEVLDALSLGPDDDPTAAAAQADILRELAFLPVDRQDGAALRRPVPRSLPTCAKVLAARVQTEVAREELPFVYEAVRRTAFEGGADGDGGAFRRAYEAASDRGRLTPGTDVVPLLEACRIGSETAAGERGQDLLTRTGGRAVRVAANMVTGEHAGLGLGTRVAAPLRQLGLVAYILTESLTTSTRTGLGVSVFLFATAGATIAVQLLGGDVNGGLLVLASAVLIGGTALAVLRSGLWPQFVPFLALIAVALAIIGPDKLTEVITQPEGTPIPDWKNVLFLQQVSVASVIVWVGLVAWSISLAQSTGTAFRVWYLRRTVGSFPIGALGQVVLTVVGLVVALNAARIFELLVKGHTDELGRSVPIDVARALHDQRLVVVVAGVVLGAIFLGMAWDRSVRGTVRWLAARLPGTRPWRTTHWILLGISGVTVLGCLVAFGWVGRNLPADHRYLDFQKAGPQLQSFLSELGATVDGTNLRNDLHTSTNVDLVFTPASGLLLLVLLSGLAHLAGRVQAFALGSRRFPRDLFTAAGAAVVLAALSDEVENVLLLAGFNLWPADGATTNRLGSAAATFGNLKWAGLGAAGVLTGIALLAWLVAFVRPWSKAVAPGVGVGVRAGDEATAATVGATPATPGGPPS